LNEDKLTRRTLLKSGVAATTAAGMMGLQGGSPLAAPVVRQSIGDELASQKADAVPEPNLEIARNWWAENPNKRTPIGWKNHPQQFVVMYNGIIISPSVVLTFNDPNVRPDLQLQVDGRTEVQGWNNCEAPVLWTRWFPYTYSARAFDGVQIQQEVFVHLPGATDINTGKEPLFAWVRLSILDICEGFFFEDQENECTFRIKINAPDFQGTMVERIVKVGKAYPVELTPQGEKYDSRLGWRLLDPKGKVCLAIPPGQECGVSFQKQDTPNNKDNLLTISVKLRKGASVDLLLPALSADRDVVDQELALGCERALEEANGYWSKKPATAARFEVPEEEVNQILRRHLQFAEIIAEKHTDGFTYVHHACRESYYTVGPVHANMLPLTYLLGPMGYQSAVEKYLQGFKAFQGKGVPMGPLSKFPPHPGYLTEPQPHPGYFVEPRYPPTSYRMSSDHGALLWAISHHALLSGDPEIVEQWTPVVVKACEWIQFALSVEVPGGISGIMPPDLGSDIGVVSLEVWTDAFAYKGLTTAIKLLRRVGHPRAEEFVVMAKKYRETYQQAIRAKTRQMPTWTGPDGKKRHSVPTNLSDKYCLSEIRNAWSLFSGPLALVWGGLLDADDELMENTRLWFREGPPKKFAFYDQISMGIPCLFHELCTNMPQYSWVMWHSWQLGDRQRYLEAMYANWMGAHSQQTYSVCETRGGEFGETPQTPSNFQARLAVIDDLIRDNELHLLRMMPLAWLSTEREAKFENMPTYYGPVDLRVKLAGAEEELDVSFTPRFRTPPNKTVLHVPPLENLRAVRLNGKQLEWDPGQSVLTIG